MSKLHGFPCSASCLKIRNGEDYWGIFPKMTKTAATAAAAVARNLEGAFGGGKLGNCKCSLPNCEESIKPRLMVNKKGKTARIKHVRFLVDDPVHPHREGISLSGAAPVDCSKQLHIAQISSVQVHLDEVPLFSEKDIDPNSAAGASIKAFDKVLAKASRVTSVAKKSQPIFEDSGSSQSNSRDMLDKQYVEMLVQMLKVKEQNNAVLSSKKISVSVDEDRDNVEGIRTANVEVLQEADKVEGIKTAKKTLASLDLWKLYNYPKGDSSTESEGSIKYDSDDSYFSAIEDKETEKEKAMDADREKDTVVRKKGFAEKKRVADGERDRVASDKASCKAREKEFAEKWIADRERDRIASDSAISEARKKAFEEKIRDLRKDIDQWGSDIAVCEARERAFEEKIKDVCKGIDIWCSDIAICESRERAFAEDREIAATKENAKAQKQHERAALKETAGDRVAEKAPVLKETGEEVVTEEEPKKVGLRCNSSFSDLEKLSRLSQKMKNTQRRNERVAEAFKKKNQETMEKADNSRLKKFSLNESSLKDIHDDTGWIPVIRLQDRVGNLKDGAFHHH